MTAGLETDRQAEMEVKEMEMLRSLLVVTRMDREQFGDTG